MKRQPKTPPSPFERDRHSIEDATVRLDRVLTTTTTGHAGAPRATTLLELALEHAHDWMTVGMPSGGIRGGSSHPTEVDDQLEVRRLAAQVARDVVRLPELCLIIDRASRELASIVSRLTEVIDHSKLPTDDQAPGCRSCARRLGSHDGNFEPVYEKAKASGLCRWCYDYVAAEGQWPPVEACHIRHAYGARKASLWLQQQPGHRKAS